MPNRSNNGSAQELLEHQQRPEDKSVSPDLMVAVVEQVEPLPPTDHGGLPLEGTFTVALLADQTGVTSLTLAPGDPDTASLAEHAAEIRRLHKRYVDDLIEIGRRLTESQKLVQHGDWLGWLNREFSWSDRTARNFMYLYGLATKLENFSNLNLPTSVLYLLAAPSTPASVRDEIVERAAAGEAIKVADVKKAIKTRKSQANSPSTKDSSRPLNTATAGTPKATPATRKPNNAGAARRISSHLDILEVWNDASLEERIKAINSIGLRPLLKLMPDDWWPLLEDRVAARQQQQTSASKKAPKRAEDDDLTIPEDLHRSHPVDVGGGA
jgi:Protein of unknown function (DUF3102)